MKKLMTLLILITVIAGYGETILRNWRSYTNTTHISDLEIDGDLIYMATWGGLLEYDYVNGSFEGPLKMEDGLTNNELSSIELLPNGTLLIGSKTAGINRITDGQFKMPLSEENGLSSDKVFALASYNDKYVAITEDGISVFSELPIWPLPAVTNYNMGNGLSSTHFNAIAISDDGILYCGSDSGIDYTDLKEEVLDWKQLNTSNSELGDNYITSISCSGNDTAIGTKSGIYYFEDIAAGGVMEKIGEDISYYPVYLDEQGNIWASKGYWDEDAWTVKESDEIMMIKFGSDGSETEWTQDELGTFTSMVTCIKEFQEGILISTWGEGILTYNRDYWSDKITQDCIGANFTTTLKYDNRDRLWVGNGILSPPDIRRGNRGLSVWDGYEWRNYSSENSGLVSNNINSIVPLPDDRFWFTSYSNLKEAYTGINILDYSDPDDPQWDFFYYMDPPNEDPFLPGGNIGSSILDDDGNIWLCIYNNGVMVTTSEFEEVEYFVAPEVVQDGNSNAIYVYQGDNYTLIGGKLKGFELWTGEGVPETDAGAYWEQPANVDFRTGHVLDVVERHLAYKDELWVATTIALYMYDGDNWYRFGKESTKCQYLTGSGSSLSWEPQTLISGENDSPDWWYFQGQERLYGGVTTYPTALLIDPFNNIWIGTENNGICRYDRENNKFKTWNMDNSPILSNKINDLIYDKYTGMMYIATSNGLNSVMIGVSDEQNQEEELDEIVVYPNPFHPDEDGLVMIENKDHLTMPMGGTTCKIFDLEGLLVRELELNNFQQFEWDGTNAAEKKCSSGIYFYLVSSSDGDIERGKVILVR